jgi:hypothetical protein
MAEISGGWQAMVVIHNYLQGCPASVRLGQIVEKSGAIKKKASDFIMVNVIVSFRMLGGAPERTA